MAEGLVGGRGSAVDAGTAEADASRRKGVASSARLNPGNAGRVAGEHLAVLDHAFGAATDHRGTLDTDKAASLRFNALARGRGVLKSDNKIHI